MTYLDGIVAFHRARAASDTRNLDGLYAQVGVDVLARLAAFNKARNLGPVTIPDGMTL